MAEPGKHTEEQARALLLITRSLLSVATLTFFTVMAIVMVHFMGLENIRAAWKAFRADPVPPAPVAAPAPGAPAVSYWQAPVFDTVSDEAVTYGRELIANTALYLGPKGKVAAISNGMNCQNCHLDAGTRVFGNNYSAVASTYPKFRARSGMEESIEKRVNDCFERSLNGEALAEDSREMRAIVAYIRWLGTEVPKGEVPPGSGLVELGFLDRAADPEKGKSLYDQKCMSCHGKEGAGQYNAEGTAYAFPPLWGEHSYNTGAGLFRLSRFASYIKANMPLGATHLNPQLSDEEAWDIAAFVNSQDRPGKDIRKDWPDISKKPADHPFGPFSDGFSEKQHRLGPFGPIRQAAQEKKQSRKQGG